MPKRILLADDSITIQKVVELTFSDGDYEIVSANNGARALQKLAESMPDIILSDIIMPEKNGYEVCEFVKSHPEYRDIPVILLTGTFEPFDPDRAQKAGCDAVVTKPFESQSLINKVEELIQKRRIVDDQSRAQRAEAFVRQPLEAFIPAASSTESAAEPQPDHSATMPWQMPTIDQSAGGQEAEDASSAPFGTDEEPLQTAPADQGAADDDSPFDAAASGWQPITGEQQPESPLAAQPFDDSLSDPHDASAEPGSEDAVFGQQPSHEPAAEWSEPETGDVNAPAFADGDGSAGGGPFDTVASSFDAQPEQAEEPLPENLPEQAWAAPVDHAWAMPAVDAGEGEEAPENGRTLPFPAQDDDAGAWAEPAQDGSAADWPEPAKDDSAADWPEPMQADDGSYSAPTIISPSGVADGFAAWAPQTPAGSAEPSPSEELSDSGEASFESAPEQQDAFDETPAADVPPEMSAPPDEPAAEYDPSAIWESAPEEQQESLQPGEPEIAVPAEQPAASAARSLTDEDVERIARRVVELMTGDVVKNIAWEVVPDVAEMVVRERVRQLEDE